LSPQTLKQKQKNKNKKKLKLVVYLLERGVKV